MLAAGIYFPEISIVLSFLIIISRIFFLGYISDEGAGNSYRLVGALLNDIVLCIGFILTIISGLKMSCVMDWIIIFIIKNFKCFIYIIIKNDIFINNLFVNIIKYNYILMYFYHWNFIFKLYNFIFFYVYISNIFIYFCQTPPK